MHASRRNFVASLLVAAAAMTMMTPWQVLAATQAELDAAVPVALQNLYKEVPEAKDLGAEAKGILVFPSILKGGLVIGGAGGDGAMLVDGKTAGYYNSAAFSYGLQVGVQSFSYALFFMSDETLQYLDNSDGWEIGIGPSIVVVDAGAAGKFSTTSAKDDVYAFIYGQEGLMAGMGLEGAKITKITPDP